MLASDAARVADVGCGYMRGTIELLRHHKRVYAIDSELQRARISARLADCEREPAFAGFRTISEFEQSQLRLEGAYLVNVLHTLPSVDQRLDALRMIRRNVRRAGFVLIDVPAYEHYYKDRMRPSNRFGDGYVFEKYPGRFTFYRFTTPTELDGWAASAGFMFERRFVDHHHWVRLYRAV